MTFYSNQTYLSCHIKLGILFPLQAGRNSYLYKLDIVSQFANDTPASVSFKVFHDIIQSKAGNGYCIYPPWIQTFSPV